MKALLSVFLLCLAGSYASARGGCVEEALEVAPQLSAEMRREFESKLARAKEEFEKNRGDVERVIWLGRRTAYLGHYREAIGVYTEGLKRFPADARLYRHRGHRLITLRCFDEAAADFERAARLVRGKPDEVEPDGLPNARNTPTGTLQSNVWYHLGLAYYLKRDFGRALKAYREAEKVSNNPDMLVATTYWLYLTLRRLGREAEAARALAGIKDGLDIVENADYYKLLKLYQGRLKPEDLLGGEGRDADSLSNATVAYGVGNWHLSNGRRAEAERLFRYVTDGKQWSSFGYIAAEAELKSAEKGADPQ